MTLTSSPAAVHSTFDLRHHKSPCFDLTIACDCRELETTTSRDNTRDNHWTLEIGRKDIRFSYFVCFIDCFMTLFLFFFFGNALLWCFCLSYGLFHAIVSRLCIVLLWCFFWTNNTLMVMSCLFYKLFHAIVSRFVHCFIVVFLLNK